MIMLVKNSLKGGVIDGKLMFKEFNQPDGFWSTEGRLGTTVLSNLRLQISSKI